MHGGGVWGVWRWYEVWSCRDGRLCNGMFKEFHWTVSTVLSDDETAVTLRLHFSKIHICIHYKNGDIVSGPCIFGSPKLQTHVIQLLSSGVLVSISSP